MKPSTSRFTVLIIAAGIFLVSPTHSQIVSPVGHQDLVVQGYSEDIEGTKFWYHSLLPDIHDAYLVRAIDGKQRAVWMTAPVPDNPAGGKIHFVWMAGLGSNLGEVAMTFRVGGLAECIFTTGRNSSWDRDFGDGFRLSYRNVMKDGAGDLFGFMFLTMPADAVRKGSRLELSVTGSASNSQAWYMTFRSAIPTGLTFNAYPAIYRKSGKQYQPVTARIVYFGQPADATLLVNGIRQASFRLDFGIQQRNIEMEAVEYPSPVSFRLESPLLTQEKMITLEPVRPWQIFFVQHTHTDIGYTRPQTEVLAEHLRYIDYALDYCDATDHYPEDAMFRWTCEAAFAVDQYLVSRPERQIHRLKERIREGRIEVTGMYFNFDETPDEQSYAASLRPIKRFHEEGIPVLTAMQNDVNGIGWCFADFFPTLGVKYLNMGTHGHRALIPFNHPTPFWWESPSGSRMLTFRAEHYMIGNTLMGIHTGDFNYFETKVMEYLVALNQKGYPWEVIPIQHSGYQTDNSPPSTRSSEMVKAWNEKYEWPKIKTATVSEFFRWIEREHSEDLPVIRGAWPDWWTDGYGSAAREVAASRQAHTDIIANQGALSMARWLGSGLPEGIVDRINLVNEALLFYDEHTFGHAQSIREPLLEGTMEQRSLKESYAWEAFRRSRMVGEEAMGLLQEFAERDASHATISLFNTLNWERSGTVQVYIDHQILPMGSSFRILNPKGDEIAAQAGEHRSDGTWWTLWVDNLPPLGYLNLILEVDVNGQKSFTDGVKPPLPTDSQGNLLFENEFYRATLSGEMGTLTSIVDKKLGIELCDLESQWQMGQFIHETLGNRSQMEAFQLTDYQRSPADTMWFESYEEGPVWTTFRFKGESTTAVGPEGLLAEWRFYRQNGLIELVYRVRKKSITDPEAIYIAFPFKLDGGKIFAEVQGGVMEAGVDQIPGSANDWNTVQNFATVRNQQQQIILSSHKIPLMQFGGIQTGRYLAGAKPESNHIFGWPMNNYWTTNFNADQRGEFTFSYFITSSGNPGVDHATQTGWGLRVPVLARVLPPGKPRGFERSWSLWSNQPENLLLVNARPIQKALEVILQIREISGREARFEGPFSAGGTLWRIAECDVNGKRLESENNSIIFKPMETKFISIYK